MSITFNGYKSSLQLVMLARYEICFLLNSGTRYLVVTFSYCTYITGSSHQVVQRVNSKHVNHKYYPLINYTVTTMYGEPLREPTCSRLLLLNDGRCVGCFARAIRRGGEEVEWEQSLAHKSAIMLEASGHCFTSIESDGTSHKHFTRYPATTPISHVAQVLSFRNRYSFRPYMCPSVSPQTVDNTVNTPI